MGWISTAASSGLELQRTLIQYPVIRVFQRAKLCRPHPRRILSIAWCTNKTIIVNALLLNYSIIPLSFGAPGIR